MIMGEVTEIKENCVGFLAALPAASPTLTQPPTTSTWVPDSTIYLGAAELLPR